MLVWGIMTEDKESPEDQDPVVDTNIIDGTEDELFDALVEIGFGNLKKEQSKKKAKILHTLINKYKFDMKTITIGLENLGVKVSRTTAGTMTKTMNAFIDKPESTKKKAAKGTKSIEEKIAKVAEEDIVKKISKDIHEKINTDNEMGDWIRVTYGPIAQIYNWPTSVLVATAMDYWLNERPKVEALLEEILGDDMYKTAVMNDLVEAASPNFLALEKMKLMNQMTELVTLLRAYGLEVPQNLLPAHMKALDEMENAEFYGG